MSKVWRIGALFLCQLIIGWIMLRLVPPDIGWQKDAAFHFAFCLGILLGYFHCWMVGVFTKEEDVNGA